MAVRRPGSYCADGVKSQAIYEPAEAYSVYSALISQSWMGQAASVESFVIVAETCTPAVSPRARVDAKDQSEGVAGALADYERLVRHRWKFQRRFHMDRPYQLVALTAIERMIYGSGGSWEAFYKAYPKSGGYLSLSPVGFNDGKSIAVVAAWRNSEHQSMSENCWLVYKKGQKWTVTHWPAGGCGWVT